MSDPSTPPPIAPAVSAPRTAPIAVWSLALAILSFCGWLFTAIPAVICGHIARAKIRKSDGALTGTGMATAGLVIGYLAVAVGILGIPLFVGMIQSDRERIHQLKVEKKEIAASDGKLTIATSGMWTKTSGLNNEASLQISDKSKDMYLIVITDAKSAVGNMSLERHHQLTRDHMLEKMENSSATDAIPLTIDEHRALQDEVSGRKQNADLVFLHTTVDDGAHFQQILAWTTKSRWPEQSHELREATGTFRSED